MFVAFQIQCICWQLLKVSSTTFLPSWLYSVNNMLSIFVIFFNHHYWLSLYHIEIVLFTFNCWFTTLDSYLGQSNIGLTFSNITAQHVGFSVSLITILTWFTSCISSVEASMYVHSFLLFFTLCHCFLVYESHFSSLSHYFSTVNFSYVVLQLPVLFVVGV